MPEPQPVTPSPELPVKKGPSKAVLRWLALLVAVTVIVIAILALEKSNPQRSNQPVEEVDVHMGDSSFMDKQEMYEPAKEITTPDGFINVEDITINELIGEKVILIDFWTYSCINCQRTTPYLNAWYETYKDQGLEIIGIHTPEFAFEEEYENVQQAVEQFGIEFPVVLDNDYSTWRAYENRFWPRKYLIDIDGFIVYDHIGEGAYEETEQVIQDLLSERASRLGGVTTSFTAEPVGVVDVDFSQVNTREIYFGASRNEYLGNGLDGILGVQTLSLPDTLAENALYLDGQWEFEEEFARNISTGGIVINYDAKEVYMVASGEGFVTLRVFLDGQPLAPELFGADVELDSEGAAVVEVNDERLYHIISGQEYGPHLLELFIDNEGLNAFTFTFG